MPTHELVWNLITTERARPEAEFSESEKLCTALRQLTENPREETGLHLWLHYALIIF